jgi:hypothetical protein
MFRFDTLTGEGYRFMSSNEEYNNGQYRKATLIVEAFHTRSKLTGEPLRQPNVSKTLLSQVINADSDTKSGERHDRMTLFDQVFRTHHTRLIALVAQGSTLDIYADLVHLVRVENATILHGQLGFNLTLYRNEKQDLVGQAKKGKPYLFDQIRVWIP